MHQVTKLISDWFIEHDNVFTLLNDLHSHQISIQ